MGLSVPSKIIEKNNKLIDHLKISGDYSSKRQKNSRNYEIDKMPT